MATKTDIALGECVCRCVCLHVGPIHSFCYAFSTCNFVWMVSSVLSAYRCTRMHRFYNRINFYFNNKTAQNRIITYCSNFICFICFSVSVYFIAFGCILYISAIRSPVTLHQIQKRLEICLLSTDCMNEQMNIVGRIIWFDTFSSKNCSV